MMENKMAVKSSKTKTEGRTKKEIEAEMRELFPKKELAYADYRDNEGDSSGLRERLWEEFNNYRNRWNKLVDEYEAAST